jgi:CRP-like cAMP-binding protein
MISPNLFRNLFRDKDGTSYTAGQYIFKAGDPGESMYIVTEGEVEVRDGSTVLDTIGAGSIIGELALIDDAPRSASVLAKTDCRLVAVDRRQFEFMVQETPFFALTVMKVLADRLRKTSAKVPPK